MTLETCYVAEVADILALRFECPRCQTVVTWRLLQRTVTPELPHLCPRCQKDVCENSHNIRQATSKFVDGLEEMIRGLTAPDCPYRIRLALARPVGSPAPAPSV